METRVYSDADALAEAAADLLYRRILSAIEAEGRAALILSGGTTPRDCYARLSALILSGRVDARKMLWIFADERWVPVADQESNEGMIRAMLLSPIGAPEDTILSWNAGRGDPPRAALDYAARLRARMAGDRPCAAVMGIGADGHTASLFPGSHVASPDGSLAPMREDLPTETAAVRRDDGTWRLTLCPSFLNRARLAVFLAAGPSKREAAGRARRGDAAVPASWVRGEETVFMITRDAAERGGPDFGREIRLV